MSFIDLPPEIRNEIYGLCLIVDGHITPYPEFYPYDKTLDYKGDKIRVNIALLRVSRTISAEAEAVFYGTNTFRITSRAPTLTIPPSGVLVYPRDTLWFRKRQLIRHVAIYYSQLDVDPIKKVLYSWQVNAEPNHSREERADLIHVNNNNDLFASWFEIEELLTPMVNLATLVMDMKDLYCATGCCRRDVLRGMFLMVMTPWSLPPGINVQINGLQNDEEKQWASKWRAGGQSTSLLTSQRKIYLGTD